jgi:transcriptional regulator NrdR family protein
MIFCPNCKCGTKVVDSRIGGNTVRRRRMCFECKERWTTYEVEASLVSALNEVEQYTAEIAAMAPKITTAIEDYEVRRYQSADVVSKVKPSERPWRRKPADV